MICNIYNLILFRYTNCHFFFFFLLGILLLFFILFNYCKLKLIDILSFVNMQYLWIDIEEQENNCYETSLLTNVITDNEI